MVIPPLPDAFAKMATPLLAVTVAVLSTTTTLLPSTVVVRTPPPRSDTILL
jgi:hypothetical protein